MTKPLEAKLFPAMHDVESILHKLFDGHKHDQGDLLLQALGTKLNIPTCKSLKEQIDFD